MHDGEVTETSVVADSRGRVFVEFSEGTNVRSMQTKGLFSGEILPPVELTDFPSRAPRARMRRIFAFELLPDSAEDLMFSGIYTNRPYKELLKHEYFPNIFGALGSRPKGVNIYAAIHRDDKVQTPALYRYFTDEDGYLDVERLGGKYEETPDEEVKVFSATITRSGTYVIFDENPPPTFTPVFLEDRIEMVEVSPYPSVVPLEQQVYELAGYPGGEPPPRQDYRVDPLEGEEGSFTTIPDPLYPDGQAPNGNEEVGYRTFNPEGEVPSIIDDPYYPPYPETPIRGQDGEIVIPALPDEDINIDTEGEIPPVAPLPQGTSAQAPGEGGLALLNSSTDIPQGLSPEGQNIQSFLLASSLQDTPKTEQPDDKTLDPQAKSSSLLLWVICAVLGILCAGAYWAFHSRKNLR